MSSSVRVLSLAGGLAVLAAGAAIAASAPPAHLVDVLGQEVPLAGPQAGTTVLIFMSRSAKDASSAFARQLDERMLDRPIQSVGIVDVRRYGGLLKRVALSYLKRSAEESKVKRRQRREARGVDASPEAVDRWHLIGDFDGALFTRFGVEAEPAAPLAFIVDGAGGVQGPLRDVDAVVAALRR